MELNRINIYINEHLWGYFKEDIKIPLFLKIGDEYITLTTKTFQEAFQFSKAIKYTSGDISYQYSYIFEKWKMLSIFVGPKMFTELKEITYYLHTEYPKAWVKNGRYQNTIQFDEKVGCFKDHPNKMCCYSKTNDLFAEFYFLPKLWNINNHILWSKEFQKDAKIALFVLKHLSIHKDIKYCIIQALSELYKLE